MNYSCCNHRNNSQSNKNNSQQRLHPLLELDGKLDVLCLYGQSLPLVPFRPFQPLVSLLWSGTLLAYSHFDGLDKRYKMRKATIDIENIKLAQENTRKNLQTQYLNATNDLMNSQRNFKKQKDNYLLAEDVYTVTMDRYREGIASMTEVLQDEMRMSEAQNNYISAHYNYRITNLTLLKLTGQLETLSPSIH